MFLFFFRIYGGVVYVVIFSIDILSLVGTLFIANRNWEKWKTWNSSSDIHSLKLPEHPTKQPLGGLVHTKKRICENQF